MQYYYLEIKIKNSIHVDLTQLFIFRRAEVYAVNKAGKLSQTLTDH